MTRMQKINQRRRGLTILELLFAVAILAVLAALMFPTLRGMVNRAKTVNCAALIHQFGTAALAYRSEHNGFLPPGKPVPPVTDDNRNPQSSVDVKADLLGGGYLLEIPYCPSMRLTSEGIAKLKKGQSEKDRLKEMGSYAINMFLTQTKPEALPGPYWGGHRYPGDHKMMFIGEVYNCGLTWAFSQQNYALDGVNFGGLYIAPRDHGNHRLHFMFLDGHVELIGPTVTGSGEYDWMGLFDSWGKEGKYISARQGRESSQ